MPFLLYSTLPKGHCTEFSHRRQISIAGSAGPLASIQAKQNTEAKSPYFWHASVEGILDEISESVHENAIVIDLKPRNKNSVSLFKLLDVWGFSYDDWTPLAVRLETLHAERPVSDPLVFKKSFDDCGSNHAFAVEFLYLRGGVKTGTWNWGAVGRVNGALLWPDAFNHFAKVLLDSLTQSTNSYGD
jgi:hypothetical protein